MMRRVLDNLAGVVLAAGEGKRLRPLTSYLPKPLCPVAGDPLVDYALARVGALTSAIAVNVHHGADALTAHLAGRDVHIAREPGSEALGTAGALGNLRSWIDGRDVLVTNGDTWLERGLAPFAAGWDRERVRLLVVPEVVAPDFGGQWRYVGAALIPWAHVRDLQPVPSGLYEVSWRALEEQGRLDYVRTEGLCVPCDTPADYLVANLLANGGESSVGEGAVVEGIVERSVVWAGARVRAGEHLVEAIRLPDGLTLHPFRDAAR